MKALRHRVGRWLLRDAPKPVKHDLVVNVDGEDLIRAIVRRNKRKGLPPGACA